MCSSCAAQLQGLIIGWEVGCFIFNFKILIKFVAQVARVCVKAKPIWLFAEQECDVCGYAAIS
jgi:hypothetical protein